MSRAMYDHSRWTSYGGEFWQYVVHWRREWQTSSAFLPWEPHEQYEKAKTGTINGTQIQEREDKWGSSDAQAHLIAVAVVMSSQWPTPGKEDCTYKSQKSSYF